MTDHPNRADAIVVAAQDIFARWAQEEAREAAIFPLNRATLMDALGAARIATVTISFDGSGDSGQIEDITVCDESDETVMLPAVPMAFLAIDRASGAQISTSQTIEAFLEAMVYRLLTQTHPGWENNDGAYGTVTLDVKAGTIQLDHSDRYTAVEEYSHSF